MKLFEVFDGIRGSNNNNNNNNGLLAYPSEGWLFHAIN